MANYKKLLPILAIAIVLILPPPPVQAHGGLLDKHVYITGALDDKSLAYLIDVAKRSSKYDNVIVDIYSPGGKVNSTLAACKAIRNSEAHFIMRVKHFAASAATVLMECGDEVIVSNQASLVYHVVRYYSEDGIVLIDRKYAEQSLLNKLEFLRWKTFYISFFYTTTLTDKQWNELLDGKNVRIKGAQYNARR